MPTVDLRPNADGATLQWGGVGVPPFFQAIDEDVDSPNEADYINDEIIGQECLINLATVSGVGLTSSINLRVRGAADGAAGAFTVQARDNVGTQLAIVTFDASVNNTIHTEESGARLINLTQAQVDGMDLRFVVTVGSSTFNRAYAAEVVLAYSGTTDPSEMVRTLLSGNWAPLNTDGRTPVFITSTDRQTQQTRQNDVIKCYESRPRTKRRMDHRFDFATYIAAVTVQIDVGFIPTAAQGTAFTLPDHASRVLEEVERIIQAGRSDPDGYWNILETDSFVYQHQFANFQRNQMNVNCKRIVQQVPGT